MNVPFPFRVAAGALATGLDRLRTLPGDLPGITVSLAGHALRASMRVRQEIEELANRGDEVLAPITDRPQEHPAWARFDDEEEAAQGAGGDGHNAPISTLDSAPPEAPALSVAEYQELRIGQVRARLRALDAATVQLLLDFEEGHQARPMFLTALQNRLTSLRAASTDQRHR